MGGNSEDDLEERLNVLEGTPGSSPTPIDERTIDDLADNIKKSKKAEGLFVSIGKYLSNKERLKAAGVLAATIAGVAILKDKLPQATEYFRELVPSLSKETVSLTVDTLTNTLAAPMGFLLSNYAHGKKLNKREFIGQVAFAAGWGVLRHYVYSGLSNFDEVTPKMYL